ncbi:MAG: beta-propeller domain-containing protein [Phycisphaerales bacterium]|nr:MAG: beta-propeller domain-containing protein [Phycisphaerales bacterium]
MSRYWALLITVSVLLIPGCGLIEFLFENPLAGSAELKKFESEEELAKYMSDQITERNSTFYTLDARGWSEDLGGDFDDAIAADGAVQDGSSPPASEPTDGGDAGGGAGEEGDSNSHSDTTIQEEGVDEADVVKTDGTYLYVIHESLLRIVQISPPEQMVVLSEVELNGYGRDIYLYDNKVVALTEQYADFFYVGGGGLIEPDIVTVDIDDTAVDTMDEPVKPEPTGQVVAYEYQYERPKVIVTVIDVTTPEAPDVMTETAFEGSRSSSRMIDGVLHLVIANYQEYYYDVVPALGLAELEVDDVDVDLLMPGFAHSEAGGDASEGITVTWEELYRPVDPDGFGVVTVITMDVDNAADFSAVGIVAEPGLIYSSLEALYLTDSDYEFFGGRSTARQTTDIYKLQYIDGGALPTAAGTVEGRILNQYSMGEYEGYLRVATTIDNTFFLFAETDSSNNVYVLEQVDDSLDIVGRIENIAPGEDIMSARFTGDRGYLVTFEQIDPLFILNLANPQSPEIVGELKVPGFSTFLVPMDQDHLLAVGEYLPEEQNPFFWQEGVQLSIFDVSDFTKPTLKHNVIMGGAGYAYSEALYDPKAFTYYEEGGMVALPLSLYNYGPFINDIDIDIMPDVEEDGAGPDEGSVTIDDDGAVVEGEDVTSPLEDDTTTVADEEPDSFEGLIVFSVSTDAGFTELGRISTTFQEAAYYWWTAFTRGVFIGDDVFAVTNQGIRGAPVSDIDSVPYELVFEIPEEPVDVEPGEREEPEEDTDSSSDPTADDE